MSQENVNVLKRAFLAWNRGDRDGWLAAVHPEVEWSSAIQRGIEGPTRLYRGRTEVGQFWDEWHAVWDAEIDPYDFRDLGDCVVALATFRVKGKGSGAEVTQQVGYVCEFADGLVRRSSGYLTPETALEAAGLSE